MKKTFAIVALLVMVVSVVSAGSVYFDSGVSFSNGSRTYKIDDYNYEGKSVKYSMTSLPLEIGYREAFDNGVVVSGSAGVFFNLSEKFDGRTNDGDKLFPTHFSLKAQAGYGMEINKKLTAEFLGGFSYAFGSKKSEGYKLSFSTITLTAEAGVKYEIADSITLRAGAKIGIPFTTNMKETFDNGSESEKLKLSGFMFNFTPFVGAAYQF